MLFKPFNPRVGACPRPRHRVFSVALLTLVTALVALPAWASPSPGAEQAAAAIPGASLRLDRTSVLLTRDGDAATVRASATIDGPYPDVFVPILWSAADPDVLQIEPRSFDGSEVTIRAKTSLGSSMVYAHFGGAWAAVSVNIAELNEGVRVVELDSIVKYAGELVGEDGGIRQTLLLESTADTSKIRPGDLIIGSGENGHVSGLMSRVLEVRRPTASPTFEVVAEAVSLEEIYRELRIAVTGPPGPAAVPLDGADRALESSWLYRCETSTDLVEIDVAGPAVTYPGRVVRPIFNLDLSGGELRSLELGADFDMSLAWRGPSVEVEAGLFFSFDCSVSLGAVGLLPGVKLPEIPLGTSGFSIKTTPYVGVEGDIDMELGRVSLDSGGFEFAFAARLGVAYDHASRTWSKIAERIGPEFVPDLASFDTELDVRFDGAVGPYGRVQLGVGPATWLGSIASVNFLNIKMRDDTRLTVPAAAVFGDPLPPSTSYENPTWRRSWVTESTAELSLGGGAGVVWKAMVGRLAPDIPLINFETPVLFSEEEVWGRTPETVLDAPETLRVGETTSVELLSLPFDPIHTLILRGRPVEFWASRDGEPAESIGSATVDGLGGAAVSFSPAQAGVYEVVALVYDRATGVINLPVRSEAATIDVAGRFDGAYDVTMVGSGSGPDGQGWCQGETALDVVDSEIDHSFPCTGQFNGSAVTVAVHLVGTVSASGVITGTISGSAGPYADSTDWDGAIDPGTLAFTGDFDGLELGVSYSGTVTGGPAGPSAGAEKR